jgi:hypothetical protein
MVQKELRNFLNDFGKCFSNGMMEGEKMGSHHQKGFLKLKCLSLLKMLTSPLFEETSGAFLFLFLFFLSLFFSSVSFFQ